MAVQPHEALTASTQLFSIGQVLERLQNDFADVTPSKLRFLEDQGLVTPERTKSGYRKFSQSHIERLRIILTLQREHYLPLKVIAEMLTELDAGNDPLIPGTTQRSVSNYLTPRKLLSRDELLRATGASSAFLGESIAAGLIPAAEVFPSEVVAELTAIMKLAEQGLTPRHLRNMRSAAERDAELIAQAVEARGVRSNTPEAKELALELTEHLERARAGVVRRRFVR